MNTEPTSEEHPLSILIADDEPDVADIAAQLLREAGLRTTAVGTGEAAISAVALGSFDLALLNMMMPGPTGQELYGALRALPYGRDLPIVFMTVLPEANVRKLVDGEYGYLGKPFSRTELLAVVARRGRPLR